MPGCGYSQAPLTWYLTKLTQPDWWLSQTGNIHSVVYLPSVHSLWSCKSTKQVVLAQALFQLNSLIVYLLPAFVFH